MRLALVVFLLPACAAEPASGVSYKFDPCQRPKVAAPIGGTAEQVASLDDAIAAWQDAGVTGFQRDDAAPDVTVELRTAAMTFYGQYDDTTATVYVNNRITDATERAIVIAHELGHALGLFHVEVAVRRSVMNPGNLTEPPDAGDAAALAELWGGCVSGALTP